MAQLIKMSDYISRYEVDIFRYPSQYIRFKKENWRKIKYLWEEEMSVRKKGMESHSNSTKKKWFKKTVVEEEQDSYGPRLPFSEEELKHYFLDRLFPFQLKWATSTVGQVSFMDKKFETDAVLKFFLQRLPDTYFLMYYPIFNINKAPVDGEIILISPLGIEIIYLLETESDQDIIQISDNRSWTVQQGNYSRKILSPVIALKRTEKIIQAILNKHNHSFPISKVVLSRTNIISYLTEPYKTEIIDRNRFEDWLIEKKSLVSPLKGNQLKAAEQILANCQSYASRRPEWEDDDQSFSFVDEV